MPDDNHDNRRAGAHRRVPQPWPEGRRFRILSLDGGGIRGIFPAAVLAGLEKQFTGGRPISAYFDLVVGTSTGGIIALGLGAGLSARDMRDIFVDRGGEVFPPLSQNLAGWLRARLRSAWRIAFYAYDRHALRAMLKSVLNERWLLDSSVRLCIPAFEGKYSSVYIFKTPHDPIYRMDWRERMVDVALATAAAPTYFKPLQHRGYTLVDGGVWANNPTMIGVVEALVAFTVTRDDIDVLSIGCGDDPYVVSRWQRALGGMWSWRSAIFAAMRLQSAAATNQARLLLGPSAVTRVEPAPIAPPIELDDWRRAKALLPAAADDVIAAHGAAIAARFLVRPASAYRPHPDAVVVSSR